MAAAGEARGAMSGALAGRTALVTGASRGIGLAIARALAAEGAWVGMAARGREALERAAAEAGGHPFPADVSEPAEVDALVAAVAARIGGAPDVLVASAGVFALAPIAATSPEQFDRHLAVNLRAPFLLVRALLPAMLARRAGHIVSIGSVAGRTAMPGNGAYGASKFGLRGLHEVLAEEVRGTGVRATLVEPAATDTPLWDLLDPDHRDDLPSRASMLRPEQVADAVVYLLRQPPPVEIGLLTIRSNG